MSARLINSNLGKDLVVNVILDTGSDITLMTAKAAEVLELEGDEAPFQLSGVTDQVNQITSQLVDVDIQSMDNTFIGKLERVRVIPVITKDVKAFDWRPVLERYGLKGHAPAGEGHIDLLIGCDNLDYLLQKGYVRINSQCVLIKTLLGWSGLGTFARRQVASAQSFVIEYLDNEEIPTSRMEYTVSNDDKNLNENEFSEIMEGLSFVAGQSKTKASSEVKKLIEIIESSTLYDNFPESGVTVEEEYCMQSLRDSYLVEDGKVYVSPLWRKGQPSGFVNNFHYAKSRLRSILKGMSDEHFDCIDKIFHNYVHKDGVVEEITDEIVNPYQEHAIWWAHFPVMNPNSDTTPVRPVMDGKAQCLNGKSINDHCYHPGPCLINDLVQVLLRYRKYDVAFTGDVSKMFLKVHVPPDEKKFGRFVWVDKKDRGKYRYFQFKGHVFGKVCSPTCAIFATQMNASAHEVEMPRAAEAVKKSTLVDDTLDSVPTEAEAERVILDLVEMHAAIGLHVSKISTTSAKVAKALPDTISKSENMSLFESFTTRNIEYGGIEYAPGTIPKLPTVRTLGQYHNMITDSLSYLSYSPDNNIVWTKTKCLSQAMKIFDPLGYATPVLLETKLFMQELWKRGTEWTDELTEDESKRWAEWLINLPLMDRLSFGRVIMPGLPSEILSTQLHVFVDASGVAFASSAYIRITYQDFRPVYTNFVQAKNNVAPMKVKRTIPKLELMSIYQGARLAKQICETLNIDEKEVTIWSDSKTALQWLRMDSFTLMLIVHNYCEKIKKLFPIDQIRWVPGVENPADIATRPKTVPELLELSQWTYGPGFLKESPSVWPVLPALNKTSDVLDGVKKDYRMFSDYEVGLSNLVGSYPERRNSSPKDNVDAWIVESKNYRTYDKMLRVLAYVIQFLRKTKERVKLRGDVQVPLAPPSTLSVVFPGVKEAWRYVRNKNGRLEKVIELVTTNLPKIFIRPEREELEEAEMRLVHQHQMKYFSKEIKDLQCGRDLLVSSKLCRLGALLVLNRSILGGSFEILRINGRAALASHLSEKMRRPFVLHPDDEMVKKMVQYYHHHILKHMGGVKCLSCELNRSRWIVGSIVHLKRVLSECFKCRVLRPKPTVQKMAPLPSSRVPGDGEKRLAAFTVTALDAGGPWLTSSGRGKSQTKRWLLIFRCAKYGAVHLEILYSMDTASFLLALSRFVSFYAKPKRIICDNGLNFVRGNKELTQIWDMLHDDEVINNEHKIQFVFSPADAPHFNGLIERMVGEAKKNLAALLPKENLSDEDLITAFREVQRLLNNRPLEMSASLDPRDPEPLTPAHFLAGGKIHEDLVPPGIFLEGRDTLGKRYWAIKTRLDEFWTRLCLSMAPKLQEYNRWITKRKEIVKGDLVCVLEENPSADSRYRHGIVEEVHPGMDGMSRRVSVRVKGNKIIQRGLNRLYVLVPANRLFPEGEQEKKSSKSGPVKKATKLRKRRKTIRNTALLCYT